MISEIISNKNNELISNYNGISYILLKIFVNPKKKLSLNEISTLSNIIHNYTNTNLPNWGLLWSNKIDYLEDLINENGKKYPLIVDSFNYFVGMAENAITYFNSIAFDNNYPVVISHKKIKWDDDLDILYNPMNIIFDYKARDISEYIKISFFNNSYSISSELHSYLRSNNLSILDIKLIISRLLYPNFYFDLYEDVLVDNKSEKILLNIISKIDMYEEYIDSVIMFFKSIYDIDEIEWLKKRRH